MWMLGGLVVWLFRSGVNLSYILCFKFVIVVAPLSKRSEKQLYEQEHDVGLVPGGAAGNRFDHFSPS